MPDFDIERLARDRATGPPPELLGGSPVRTGPRNGRTPRSRARLARRLRAAADRLDP